MKLESLRIGDLVAKIPVIQGGMGVGVSLSGLAGNVAACGGVGIISTAQIGFRDPEFPTNPIATNLRVIKEEVQKAREIAKGGIIGVNIMVATRSYEEYVKAAVKAGVDLIISGAGLPMTLPELVMGSNVKLAPIVSSLKSAQVICKYWMKKYLRLPDQPGHGGPAGRLPVLSALYRYPELEGNQDPLGPDGLLLRRLRCRSGSGRLRRCLLPAELHLQQV